MCEEMDSNSARPANASHVGPLLHTIHTMEPCHATRPTSSTWDQQVGRCSSGLLPCPSIIFYPSFPFSTLDFHLLALGDNYPESHSHSLPLICFFHKHCRCMTGFLPLRPNRIHITSRGVPTSPARSGISPAPHSPIPHPAEPATPSLP